MVEKAYAAVDRDRAAVEIDGKFDVGLLCVADYLRLSLLLFHFSLLILIELACAPKPSLSARAVMSSAAARRSSPEYSM